MEINETVGKWYKRPNDKVRKVVGIDNGFVIFDDAARVKYDTLMAQFEETIDPEAFLNNYQSLGQLGEDFKDILEGTKTAPTTSVSIGVGGEPDVYQPPIPQVPQHYQQQPQQQFQNTAEPDEAALGLAPQQQQQPVRQIAEQISPEVALFRKMKRVHKIALNLKIEQLVPEPKSVKTMNDMFEMSVIDFLADDIYNSVVGDAFEFKQLIKEQLEIVLLGKKPVVKKPAAKKKVVKRELPPVPPQDRETI